MTESKTPLYPVYGQYGAKVVDFHGWALPVQFSGILHEHEAVRRRAGMFDVSHMGRVVVEGPDARLLLNRLVTNDVARLSPGRAQYALFCTPDGGTLDDILVYCLAEQRYLLVVNAANRAADVNWIEQHAAAWQMDAAVTDETFRWAMLALQGPAAAALVQRLTEADVDGMQSFSFLMDVAVAGVPVVVLSRTGYTGEDGFELIVPQEQAVTLWQRLLTEGEKEGVAPCGLGARDTLRLEAGLPLYGNELSPDISPLEAGLEFAVKWEKGDFVGRSALQKQKDEGLRRRLVGLEMLDKGIPRAGYALVAGEEPVGYVTSGTHAPTLQKNVGLALVAREWSNEGTVLGVDVRGKRLRAVVVPKPFYRRKRQK